MSYLIIDIGNSRVKYCYAENETLTEAANCSHAEAAEVIVNDSIKKSISAAILSSTASEDYTASLKQKLEEFTEVTEVSHLLKLPFQMGYDTPATLGLDRIANVCGAIHFHPKETSLVIDIGTCITYDIIENGEIYHGGAISPGIKLRFNAMNDYSARLPRLENLEDLSFPGEDTEQSLRNGVYYGILGEMNQFIYEVEQSFGAVKVHLTGGDHLRFEKGLKSAIFANPKLTLWGLYEILKTNN